MRHLGELVPPLPSKIALDASFCTVSLPGCRPRGPGFDSQRYQIFCVAEGLERGPLSLVRINEELLERKVVAPV
jgi:hypothetical protein